MLLLLMHAAFMEASVKDTLLTSQQQPRGRQNHHDLSCLVLVVLGVPPAKLSARTSSVLRGAMCDVPVLSQVSVWQCTHPDGLDVFYYPSGQVEGHFADGRKEVIFADGAARVVNQDG